MLLFVNTSDYMATSEAAGVRLAVHSPTDFPFPDTFGYSAPVGFASSFGLKKVNWHSQNSYSSVRNRIRSFFSPGSFLFW